MRKRRRATFSHTLSQHSYNPATLSSDILAVLHDKANEFDQSRSHNERLSSWLNPTINVLYAFSATLGEGVGLVKLKWSTRLQSAPNFFFRRYSRPRN